jgi:hypothetical protein
MAKVDGLIPIHPSFIKNIHPSFTKNQKDRALRGLFDGYNAQGIRWNQIKFWDRIGLPAWS